MCFCTRVEWRWFCPQLRSELRGGELGRETGLTSSLGCFSRGKPTERRVDSNSQDFPGLLSVCLQGSVHLNAPSLFFHRLLPYYATLFISATRSPSFFLFWSVFCSFSRSNLNSTLLAPSYDISDKPGCMVITNEVCYCT